MLGFHSLSKSSQPWLKETALYMQGRVELNRAQKDAFDTFGFPDLAKVDMKAISSAEHEVQIYLQTYPAGHYAASARGLLLCVCIGCLISRKSWRTNMTGS